MAVNIAPVYVDAQLINGIPASGSKLFTYVAGSSTKQTTYQDAAGATPHANPIILNSRGEPANNGGVSMPIFLTAGLTYDFVFAPSTDTDPPTAAIRTIAGIKGVNDVSSLTDQFIASGITPTFVSATQFTLPGDQTSAFTVGRALKSSVTAGTVYDSITASVFTTLTTITVIGGALDSGLSSVSYGIITSVNPSLPTIPTAIAIASAATIDFRAVKSNEVHVTGTIAISSVLMLSGQRIKLIADAALPLTYNATTNNIIGATSYTLSAGDTVDYDYDGVTVRGVIVKADGTALVAATAAVNVQVPVRQTVLSGTVDSSGLVNFGGTTGSTTFTAAATLVVTAANGFTTGTAGAINNTGSIVNPSWTGLSTNGSMYLYLDVATNGTCTTGSTTVAPVYQWGGTYSTTNNAFTFNIQEMIGKVGNGTTASQVYRVFVGDVAVSGGVVVANAWYQLQGRYFSPLTSTFPALGTVTNISHNLGVTPQVTNLVAINKTSEFGYNVGDILQDPATQSAGGFLAKIATINTSNNNTAFIISNNSALMWLNKTTPAAFITLTAANWYYRLIANRGW